MWFAVFIMSNNASDKNQKLKSATSSITPEQRDAGPCSARPGPPDSSRPWSPTTAERCFMPCSITQQHDRRGAATQKQSRSEIRAVYSALAALRSCRVIVRNSPRHLPELVSSAPLSDFGDVIMFMGTCLHSSSQYRKCFAISKSWLSF